MGHFNLMLAGLSPIGTLMAHRQTCERKRCAQGQCELYRLLWIQQKGDRGFIPL